MTETKPLNIQDDLNREITTEIILEKCFFGKNSVLKIQLSKRSIKYDCYIHIGIINSKDQWSWIKTKFNEIELAQIIDFINTKEEKLSFFHKFKEQSKSIHLAKTQRGTIIKIEDKSKLLSFPECRIIEILLKKIIEIKNFKT